MSYASAIYKDNPSAFWFLDESSGTAAVDKSGNENTATYFGGLISGLLPIVHGLDQSYESSLTRYIDLPVNKDFYGTEKGELFGNVYHSEKPFSLEAWVKLNVSSGNKTPIVADSLNDVGIFYEDGSLVFRCGDQEVFYTLPYLKKSIHVVAVYDKNSMSLYVDGESVSQISLLNFQFSNISLSLSSGPCLSTTDSFLINAVAVYKYALSPAKIFNHYQSNRSIPAIQIVDGLGGELIEIFDDQISSKYIYSYPNNMSWNFVKVDGLVYNESDNSLAMQEDKGSKTVEFIDLIGIPSGFVLDSSKIEWLGDNGISVYTSLDGAIYTQCTNGNSIPQFRLGDFSTSKSVYLKVVFSSNDAGKFLPKLKYLTLTFYNDQKKYGKNTGSYIKTLEGEGGNPVLDISLGSKVYQILSRDDRNGIRCKSNSGFALVTFNLVSSIEFFCKTSIVAEGAFIAFAESGSYPATVFEWNSSGEITKNNISAIYVNGQDKSSETNISNIVSNDQLSHFIIVLSAPILGEIFFNYNFSETSGDEAIYQNIATYPSALSSTQALSNFNNYIYGSLEDISDNSTQSISVTENSVKYYNNDWLVVQNS